MRGGTCLDSLGFLSGRKLGQYADQELLKFLCQNKTPDSSLKFILTQVTGRVSSKDKEKRPKGKLVLKKRDQTEKKKKTVQRNRKQRRRAYS